MLEYGRRFVRLLGLLAGLVVGLGTVPEVAAGYLNGVDVSSYQGSINWAAVRNSGISFAFTKATEGTGYLDRYLNANIAGMKRYGIVPGAYHFAHPSIDPTAQANYFTNAVRNANGGNFHGLLQLVLDLEVSDGRSASQVWSWTQTFCARVQAITGRPCIIYTYYYFWLNNVGNPGSNLNCPLWLAAYVSNPTPYIPRPWTGVGWAFWQYTDRGSVPGIAGAVDRDYFKNGGSYPNINALRIP